MVGTTQENPKRVSGEDVLQGFELDLAEIF